MPDDPALRAMFLIRYYNDALAGYFSPDKTHDLLVRYFTWLGMAKDCKEYV